MTSIPVSLDLLEAKWKSNRPEGGSNLQRRPNPVAETTSQRREPRKEMNRIIKTAIAAAVAAPLALAAGPAHAASVPLTNAGFETANITTDDGFHWVHV